jgi:hypothetical protein
MRFPGFDPGAPAPDENTIRRFRDRMAETGALEAGKSAKEIRPDEPNKAARKDANARLSAIAGNRRPADGWTLKVGGRVRCRGAWPGPTPGSPRRAPRSSMSSPTGRPASGSSSERSVARQGVACKPPEGARRGRRPDPRWPTSPASSTARSSTNADAPWDGSVRNPQADATRPPDRRGPRRKRRLHAPAALNRAQIEGVLRAVSSSQPMAPSTTAKPTSCRGPSVSSRNIHAIVAVISGPIREIRLARAAPSLRMPS